MKMTKSIETKAADNIRILAASMVEKAKSGHPGRSNGRRRFYQYPLH
jgi:transketolase